MRVLQPGAGDKKTNENGTTTTGTGGTPGAQRANIQRFDRSRAIRCEFEIQRTQIAQSGVAIQRAPPANHLGVLRSTGRNLGSVPLLP
eukprot:223087-Karenia_brevis.AAC.1